MAFARGGVYAATQGELTIDKLLIMQTRTCFNGGELAPEMAARCDVDAYMRGCCVLENWELSQMGGVRRRRGMRRVCDALGPGSRIFAYEYSHVDASKCFVVELGNEVVRVLDGAGGVVALFESGREGVTRFSLNLEEVRVCQLNALMIITCRSSWPLVLRWDGGDVWSLKRVEFKHAVWRYEHEVREHPVVLTARAGVAGMEYDVAFAEEEEGELPEEGAEDIMRVSFYVEQAEARQVGSVLREGVRIEVDGVVHVHTAGERVAVRGEDALTYWVCKKDFPADVYVPGLDDPGSYPDNFELSENVSGFDGVTEVTSVQQLGTVRKGARFAMRAGYWEYFTCVKGFTEADMVPGQDNYAAYEGFFVRGVAVGEALPCRGKWEFYCSGLWYGSYEVRRSYTGPDVGDVWEVAGVSWSRLSEAENVQLAGDEEDEECWMRLYLTRSKRLQDDSLADGFVPDSCGNRLVVEGYRHDMVLALDEYGVWSCVDKVDIGWRGTRTVYDWSWGAFSARYGYPLECEVYQQRLVFGSTLEQPQSLWMSRIDDYYNFATGDSDDAAIYLTLYTTSQDPICWMLEDRGRLLLGTSNAEWVILARDGMVKPAGLEVARHGRIGSMGGVMLAAEDKALYVARGGGRLWEFGYSFEVDGCRSRDLTVFAPHVLRDHGGVRGATLLSKPDTVGVFALGDGQVALMTYNTLHNVHAWHRWVTDGRVCDVCALSSGEGVDRLYLVVERDGAVQIEVVDEDSPYVDADGRRYVSLLVTNALGNTLEEVAKAKPKVPAMVLLGGELSVDGFEVCADGGSWAVLPRNVTVLQAGWHEVLVFNRWSIEHAIGLRYQGESGCCVLALQG